MDLIFELASIILDQLTKTNMTWYTKDSERSMDIAAISMTSEMQRKEEEPDE